MRKIAFALLAAAFSLQPGFAQPAPAPDALVERLLTVLPDANLLTGTNVPPPDPAEVSRLNGLNPGHEAEIMAALQAYQNCLTPVVAAATGRGLRHLIRGLGEAKVSRLIQFYQGDDYRALAAIHARQAGSESDRRETARILATYPLAEFAQLIPQLQQTAMQDDAFLAGATRCSLAKRDTFQQQGIRFR